MFFTSWGILCVCCAYIPSGLITYVFLFALSVGFTQAVWRKYILQLCIQSFRYLLTHHHDKHVTNYATNTSYVFPQHFVFFFVCHKKCSPLYSIKHSNFSFFKPVRSNVGHKGSPLSPSSHIEVSV